VTARGAQTWKVTPARREPRAFLHLGAAAGVLAAAPIGAAIFPLLGIEAPARIFVAVLGPLFVIGVVWTGLALRLLRRKSPQTVTVGPDAVEIVGSPTSPVHVRRLALGRIASIEPPLMGPPAVVVFVEGWGLPAAFGGKDADPALLAEVATTIRERIADLPDGVERLGRLDASAWARKRLVPRVPRATLATCLLLIVGFALQWAASCVPLERGCGALAWANAPDRVAAGEAYRLLTSNLVHTGLLHLGLNLLGLATAGSLMELILGWRRSALVYLAAGIAAPAASAAFTATTVVGASGIAYASLGALFWLRLRRSRELPGVFLLVHVAWLALGLGFLAELAYPAISSTTHIAGFLVGFTITPVLIGKRPLFAR